VFYFNTIPKYVNTYCRQIKQNSLRLPNLRELFLRRTDFEKRETYEESKQASLQKSEGSSLSPSVREGRCI
jgi:hypothetical protein